MSKHDHKKHHDEEVIKDTKDKIKENIPDNEKDIIEELNKWIEETKEAKEKEDKSDDLTKLKEAFARQQADYDNFKKRVERDKEDMMFFLKSDILKKILPRIDDLQRIIEQTPEEQKNIPIYTWITAIEKKLTQDLEKMWVIVFNSKWEKIDPDKHEVMTQIPWEEWIIIEEFEKWYMIGDRVLRVAKVVVWQG